jgi:hypothetical protein
MKLLSKKKKGWAVQVVATEVLARQQEQPPLRHDHRDLVLVA